MTSIKAEYLLSRSERSEHQAINSTYTPDTGRGGEPRGSEAWACGAGVERERGGQD